MGTEFTPAQVTAIAALAQLELEPHEVQLFARQLGDFLTYADEVLAIDTAGVAPTAAVLTRPESERPDQVRPSLDREAALRGAPDASIASGFFRVPRVIG
ncbi:MAG: Asp-tRNA(Asn)/Glu-tRNA(Gln) amidotransferase subunit GatC [Acidobacteriota bacterium]